MNINVNSHNVIEIEAHAILTLEPESAAELVVQRGTIWVTDTSGPTDWMLGAGERYVQPAGATAYVEALDDGAVRLYDKHLDGRSVAHKRTWFDWFRIPAAQGLAG